nr:IpaC/SipC family type III secretion system effector [uncultured Enterobacter sp.]
MTAINTLVSNVNVSQYGQLADSTKVQTLQTLRMSDTSLVNDIVKNLTNTVKAQNSVVDMRAGVRSPEFTQLQADTLNVLQGALKGANTSDSVTLTMPKSSQHAALICMLIDLANQASIADIELSSVFGVMSEKSSLSAAKAQQAQGMAIFAKSIVSSSINLAGNGVATRDSVKNYSAGKVNINQNLKGMHDADLNIRQMQNALNASKNDRLDLADIAASSSKVKNADGADVELRQQERTMRSEHQAVANRNLDEMIGNRDSFNAAFMQGESRTRLTSAQIEAKRSIGMAGSNVADGTGSMANSVEQKNETEERSEAKVMDGAVDMSRQQAQKSQQLLANMMNMLSELRRNDADLVSAFANNLKA